MREKPVEWVGSTKEDLMSFSKEVVQAVGYALYYAQQGKKHKDTKVLKGFHGADIP